MLSKLLRVAGYLVLVVLVLSGSTSFSAQDATQMPNRCVAVPATSSVRPPAWNGWGADNSNTRFQPAAAAQLRVADVSSLKLKWAFGFPGARALSAGTGKQIWPSAGQSCQLWQLRNLRCDS